METDKIKINGQTLTPEGILYKLQKNNLPEWEKSIYEFILNWFDRSEYIFQKTSGSTGAPKEIQLKKSAMKASARKTLNFFDLNENNTVWLCLPIEYIAGKMMVVRALVGNLNLIFSEPEGMPQIPNQQIDFAAMVPLQVQNMVNKKSDFSKISKIIIGGAALSSPLQQSLKNLNTEIFATYGMTETCSHIALQRINGSAPDRAFKILPGISVDTDENNCLIIYAPELSDKPINTNDCVELLSENEFLIKGRNDNAINSGGIKIFPEDVEYMIGDLIKSPFLIVPVPDQLLGQKAILAIEGKVNDFDSKQLLSLLKKRLGKHLAPKEIRFVKSLPRNASMKIDRRKIQFLFE
ncbi:MAG: AMP-binding protein [Prolixibacteraceae bacterium]|nr:AMP-binding protein [Prolixibacteraceae bacterium]